MPIAWYIVPYKTKSHDPGPNGPQNVRYCAIDDYTQQIHSSGGQWAETEVLGNRAVVKVRASQTVLNALDGIYKRIPKDRLDDLLTDLPVNVKNALRNEILDMGYSSQEIKNRFGNDIGQYTLKDVLKFMAKRRLKPRYDMQTDEIVLDGPEQTCRPIESVDTEVQE